MSSAQVLTTEERAHIEELERRMKGLMDDEYYEDDSLYRRFLRARNYNVDDAEEMLKKCLEWRKLNRMSTIIADYKPSEVLENYIPITRFGYDKDGALLTYFDLGNFDTRGLLKVCRPAQVVRHLTWVFESDIQKMKEQSAKHGKPVEQFTYVVNLENFSVRTATHKPTIECMDSIISVFDANFPERLKNAFLVNGSAYYSIFWAVVTPFIPGETFKKVRLFGKDHWKEELLKCIDADVLPVFLGGTRTDPDGNPECRTIVKYGEMIPNRFYSTRRGSVFSQKLTSKKMVVDRRSKAEMRLRVEHPNSKIEYEFELKNKDIAFSVLYEKDGSKMEETIEIIPKQRIQTDTPEVGVFLCDRSGIYILQFDNSYSWVHEKEIYYTTRIVAPNNQKSYRCN